MVPSSGTYAGLSITILRGWIGPIFQNDVPRNGVRYKLGADNNDVYQNVSVNFYSDRTITWNQGAARLGRPIPQLNAPNGIADSQLYENELEPGTYILVSKHPTKYLQNGQTVDHHLDTNKWYWGDRSYGYDGDESNFVPCFLPGTMIATPSGTMAVEDLRIGDEIIAYDVDGLSYTDTLKWVGKQKTSVRQKAYPDESGYPVRVLKDAIAEGVPFKDLLVTSEHCLFFDGKFIPARMLVNGSSIFYDTSFTSYEYFHIETENHSIVMADGMLTESYLDTGNRNVFQQQNTLFLLGRQQQRSKTWDRDAAAPLTVDSVIIEPIYRQLEERARDMQCPINVDPVSLTEKQNLFLKTDLGQIIQPIRKSADKIVFMIPEQTRFVRIVSNASRPCDIIGPFVDDRRELGVLIGEISLFTGSQTESLTDHLRNEGLAGWNNLEKEPMRWTDGEALLPLNNVYESSVILAIQVIAGGPYLARNEQVFENRSAA